MAAINTLYAVLGLEPTATAEEIEAAYARLRQIGHGDADVASFQRMAYDTLRVPEQRAAYDRKLARQQAVAASVAPAMTSAPVGASSGKGVWVLLLLALAAGGYYWSQVAGRSPEKARDGVVQQRGAEASLDQSATSDEAPEAEQVAVYDSTAIRQPAATARGAQPPPVATPVRGERKEGFDPEYMAWSVFSIRQRNKVGSGVLIGPDRILTNCHVLAGGAMGIVVIHSMTKQVTKVEKYARLDGEDACLLYAPGAGGELIEMGSSATLQAGDILHSFGHPGGSADVIWSEGKFVDRVRLGGEDFLISANYCRPGSSGGPLVDKQGRLVGIITAGERYQSLGGEIRYGACLSVTDASVRTLLGKSMFPIGFAPAQYQKNY